MERGTAGRALGVAVVAPREGGGVGAAGAGHPCARALAAHRVAASAHHARRALHRPALAGRVGEPGAYPALLVVGVLGDQVGEPGMLADQALVAPSHVLDGGAVPALHQAPDDCGDVAQTDHCLFPATRRK